MDLSTQSISLKLHQIGIFIVSISFIIICRLVYLQIIQQHLLYIQSQKNFLRLEKIKSPRGNILDAQGNLLATNRPATDLYWHGTGNRILTDAQEDILERVSNITGKNILSDPGLLTEIVQAERYRKNLVLVEDLTHEQLSQLEEQLSAQPNILIKTTFKRHYPNQRLACHVIGYISSLDIEEIGKMGIEKICEQRLKGLEGSRLRTINSCGTSLSEIEVQKGTAGKDINMTIDLNLQKIAEATFPADQSGIIIVMDPLDGAIRALVSRPDFDPELFLRHVTKAEWETLQEKQPFLNRAFNACYPPGSIFKIVTMSAALEHGIIKQDANWFCPGYYTYASRNYGCHLHTGHGNLSTCECLTHSCNIVFYDIGRRINIDVIADYAKRFGLGVKTGAPFNEKEGLIPCKAWKRKYKHERWYTGETLSVAVGQSFLLVTPIQIARMIGSIFTQTLVKPRILVDDPIVREPLDIKPETLTFIKKSMKDVVIHGTARRVGKINGFEMYAKTSTAQVCALTKRDLGKQFVEHSWYASYNQYKQERPFVLLILIENSGSSRIPAGFAREFLIQYRSSIEHDHNMSLTTFDESQEMPAFEQLISPTVASLGEISQTIDLKSSSTVQ
jgi:penicillin-binding protein 2